MCKWGELLETNVRADLLQKDSEWEVYEMFARLWLRHSDKQIGGQAGSGRVMKMLRFSLGLKVSKF